MHSVFNCYNIAKHNEFYMNSYFTGNSGCSKRVLQSYSKRYCVASITKMFTLKGVHTIHHSTLCSKDHQGGDTTSDKLFMC
jgi:hypothetical protein